MKSDKDITQIKTVTFWHNV